MVRPAGIEPTSLVPKTSTLSIELRARIQIILYYSHLPSFFGVKTFTNTAFTRNLIEY